MNRPPVDLAAIARQEMQSRGFEPDIPAAAMQQAESAQQQPEPGLQDLTSLLWSSLDNDDSRDLDQIEWAERTAAGIRVLVGIADVDSAVAKGSPVDLHAAKEMPSRGFEPDIPAAAMQQAESAQQQPEPGLQDLTSLLWSSLDNDDSRDQ